MNRPEMRRHIWQYLADHLDSLPKHRLFEHMGLNSAAASEAEINRLAKAAADVVAACRLAADVEAVSS